MAHCTLLIALAGLPLQGTLLLWKQHYQKVTQTRVVDTSSLAAARGGNEVIVNKSVMPA